MSLLELTEEVVMHQNTKDFLVEFAELLEKYKIEIEISESCKGYGGFTADGLEFTVPFDDDEYRHYDFVTLYGCYHDASDIKKILENN